MRVNSLGNDCHSHFELPFILSNFHRIREQGIVPKMVSTEDNLGTRVGHINIIRT